MSSALLLALCLIATVSQGQAKVLRFDLPAQPLAAALQALGSQTGTNVLFDPPLVERRVAPALQAEMTLDQAFARILAGTGLKHRFLDDKIVIVNVAAEPATHVPEASKTRLAQAENLQSAQDARPQTSVGADTGVLQKVVVSAGRKEEALTAVPASVTAYSADFIQKQNIQEDGTEGTHRFIEEFYELGLGHPALPTRHTVTDRRFTHESRVSFDEALVIPRVFGMAGVFYQRDTLTFIPPGVVVPALVEGGFDPAYMSNFRFPAHEDNTAVFGELYCEGRVIPVDEAGWSVEARCSQSALCRRSAWADS